MGSQNNPDSFVYKTDRPWPNARLKVAAIVGHCTENSTRLWFRTGILGRFSVFLYLYKKTLETHSGETPFKMALGTVPLSLDVAKTIFTEGQQIDFQIDDYESDTTWVGDFTELKPDTRYGYLLYSHTEQRFILGHNRIRHFRTPPPESEQRPFQFALLSCNMPYTAEGLFSKKRTATANLDMWDFLGTTLDRHQNEIDLVIAGGDQCYSDGVDTLNIWHHLNQTMHKKDGKLLPTEEAMLSWYRDIYRGYWGFASIQQVFDSFPTYMIWDDHEIGDGWGSHYIAPESNRDGLCEMLPSFEERGLSKDESYELIQRMFRAAQKAYIEYQHSHNPPTSEGIFDYGFRRGGCAFYVLDGRGQRDIMCDDFRILGRKQFDRFASWVKTLTSEDTPFLFVTSAVPMVHTKTSIVQRDKWLEVTGLGDDLRDSWEHELHDTERGELLKVLFDAAAKGIKVSILSGDVHVSAVFSLDNGQNQIYQLTSSAITYSLSRPQSWVLKMGAADDGTTSEGYDFKRLALYSESSYALISVNPNKGEAWFKLYGRQKLESPPASREYAVPLAHSLAKIRLF